MTGQEYETIKKVCHKRGYKNIETVIALANILPLIGIKRVCRGTNIDCELTYCGKTRNQWTKVKRSANCH